MKSELGNTLTAVCVSIFFTLLCLFVISRIVPQTVLRVTGNGSAAWTYVGPLSGAPASCGLAELAFITDAPNGRNYYSCGVSNNWVQAIPRLQTGEIIFIDSGTCPANTTEMTAFADLYIRDTTSASGLVGTNTGNATQTFTTSNNVSLLGVGTALSGPTSINMTPAGIYLIPCKYN